MWVDTKKLDPVDSPVLTFDIQTNKETNRQTRQIYILFVHKFLEKVSYLILMLL